MFHDCQVMVPKWYLEYHVYNCRKNMIYLVLNIFIYLITKYMK